MNERLKVPAGGAAAQPRLWSVVVDWPGPARAMPPNSGVTGRGCSTVSALEALGALADAHEDPLAVWWRFGDRWRVPLDAPEVFALPGSVADLAAAASGEAVRLGLPGRAQLAQTQARLATALAHGRGVRAWHRAGLAWGSQLCVPPGEAMLALLRTTHPAVEVAAFQVGAWQALPMRRVVDPSAVHRARLPRRAAPARAAELAAGRGVAR